MKNKRAVKYPFCHANRQYGIKWISRTRAGKHRTE